MIEYLSCVIDPQQIQEVMDVFLSLCERASKSKMAKRLSGTVCRLKESSTQKHISKANRQCCPWKGVHSTWAFSLNDFTVNCLLRQTPLGVHSTWAFSFNDFTVNCL